MRCFVPWTRYRARFSLLVSLLTILHVSWRLDASDVSGLAREVPGWQTRVLHERFHSEGASAGDVNGDGVIDLVAGPLIYFGPRFDRPFAFTTPREFPVAGYSDQFFSHVADMDGDGLNDILCIGFPGNPAVWYRNPGAEAQPESWPVREFTGAVDNESPGFVDLIPGGLPEIVCGSKGQYGFYVARDDATELWEFRSVTRPGACSGRFAHGLGVGDVDGDGDLDLLDRAHWWANPGDLGRETPWRRHGYAVSDGEPVNFRGGAQVHVRDLDADGDGDIITSVDAHGYGLVWFENKAGEFERHTILGSSSQDSPYGIAVSQMHAVSMADIDGDGHDDIVTGKRPFAHNGKDPGGLQEPMLLWLRCVRGEEGVEFVPHEIGVGQGVGVDVLVQDLNGDTRPDVVSANKLGLAIHMQTPKQKGRVPERWARTYGRDQSKYASGLEPQAAADQMLTDEGFFVDVIAAEPELVQPIAMCFDAKGRIWVVEGHTYPTKAPDGQGADRVLILEDADGDGAFETKKVFVEGINLASGIEVGFGGVWVGAAPELLFFPDADGDDRPDGEAVVLLDGWGYQDTHETLNSFTWGPDGWLYGCHGVFTHSKVGKPGVPDTERERLNAGVWRYHPTRHEFEVFAHGTSNPWGVDYNEFGDWFVSACVIPHLYHIIQGGRYQRQAGQHFDATTYEEIQTIADHAHYTGSLRDHAYWGANKQLRPAAKLDTSVLGGGHAHCGLAIYNGGRFPAQYDGTLLFHNLHGHRVVRERVVRDGSGYVGWHQPDFALARDHHQIGVGIMVGPDGAVYTSDWHDPQTCHNRDSEIWDRSNGRIFRIRYGELLGEKPDLSTANDADLLGRVTDRNGMLRRQARRVLHERAVLGDLDLVAARERVVKGLGTDSVPADRLSWLWTGYCTGVLAEPDLIDLLSDSDPRLRGWALQLLGDAASVGKHRTRLSADASSAIGDLARAETDLRTLRYLVSLAMRIAPADRLPLLTSVNRQAMLTQDRNLPQLFWYALQPAIADNPMVALRRLTGPRWQTLREHALRSLAESESGRNRLVEMAAMSEFGGLSTSIVDQLLRATRERGRVAMPPAWPATRKQLLSIATPDQIAKLRELSVVFGDDSVAPFFRDRLMDAQRPTGQRLLAMETLFSIQDPELPTIVLQAIENNAWDAEVLLKEAVSGIAVFPNPEIADSLIKHFPGFSQDVQTSVLGTLVTRPDWSLKLLEAMESKVVSPPSVPAMIVRQMLTHGRNASDAPDGEGEDLRSRLASVWGRIESSNSQKRRMMERYQALLTSTRLEKSNASSGRVIYEANCGKCHRLFGEGGDVGPAITGANRSDVKYWLENILDPNALIGRDYQVTTFLMDDGRVVSGIIASENEDAVMVQTATDRVLVDQDEIEERALSPVSLMPEGQLAALKEQQVCDLFRYLTSPSQVPLPGVASGAILEARADALVLEAETLGEVHATVGTVRRQGMRGFGPHWSADAQLWWTGAAVGERLTMSVPAPKSGLFDAAIHMTTANDYATVSVALEGQVRKQRDLYSERVTIAEPIIWKGVPLKQGEPVNVSVDITGRNAKAKPRFMVGIDRIELLPVTTSN